MARRRTSKAETAKDTEKKAPKVAGKNSVRVALLGDTIRSVEVSGGKATVQDVLNKLELIPGKGSTMRVLGEVVNKDTVLKGGETVIIAGPVKAA